MPAAETNNTNGQSHKLKKNPVPLSIETIDLLRKVREKAGMTNDQTIHLALRALDQKLGESRALTAEERAQRILDGQPLSA